MCQWLTPVILATEEAEVRRIINRSKPLQISLQDPISKIPNTKRTDEVAQGVSPEYKPRYQKKKKKTATNSKCW
jgi:hypothetical protein